MIKLLSIPVLLSVLAFADPGIPPYPAPRPGEIYTPPAFSEYVPDALNVGDKAPELELKYLGNSEYFRLEKALGKKPIVFIFGSYTCPVFRGQVNDLSKLAEQFSSAFSFYLVYLREAHPNSKLFIRKQGQEVLATIAQTQSMSEREALAQQTKDTFHITMPILIDDNAQIAHKRYAAWPVRFVIVSNAGVLQYKGRMGPHGFWPAELKKALIR